MIQELLRLLFKVLQALFNLILGAKKPIMKLGKIGTHDELQKKYNLYAENRQILKLDPNKVPEDLRDLVAIAEKWGIGDDIIRSDLQDKATDKEKEELKRLLTGRYESINNWLDSFESAESMTDEAAAFMYMALGIDEMQLWD